LGKPRKQIARRFDVVSRGIDELQSLTNARLTIALGPPNRPPDAVEAVENAGRLKVSGDSEPWDALFRIQKDALRRCAAGGAQSPVGQLISHFVGTPIRRLLTTVGYHIRDGLTYPTLVIDLTASTIEDGTALEGALEMPTARTIGAVIGESLNAAWIHVSIVH
jgi:hypothetical protein